MQPLSGAPGRGRGRGRGPNNARGASNMRGRGSSTAMSRGQSTTFGQSTRGNTMGTTRGSSNTPRANGVNMQSSRGRRGASASTTPTQGSWQQRFDQLEKHRKRERADAITNGIIADPDKPRALSQALTPTATCTEMCPEFERMQRVTQNDVWNEEKDMSKPGTSTRDAPLDEAKMVKKFRRAAAGIEEQLPSDLRTPSTLSQTCDYLFNEVVANASELGRVHHFVWDRTRAIRNDFTILQVSNPEDLTNAVDCLERIARFHILSLHQMAGVKEKDFQYDWQQDREQLDRTLVSLMQYYDDSRGKIALPNEPEFRAYLIVFHMQDSDMEDRVQGWPYELIQHPRTRKALKLYAAASSISQLHGPLRPPAQVPIAQQDWKRFWNLVASNRTSYLTACVAEINFNQIRQMALYTVSRSISSRATNDFSLGELVEILAFNDEQEVEDYLACYKITFVDKPEGRFADIAILKSRNVLPEPSVAPRKQTKCDVVENKRFGRHLPAVISGLSVKEAQENGMVDEQELVAKDENMGDMAADQDGDNGHEDEEPVNDGVSLFVPETAKLKPQTSQPGLDFDAPQSSVFGQPTGQPNTGISAFGKPSAGTFGAASGDAAPSLFSSNGFSAAEKPATSFNFMSGASNPPSTTAAFNPAPNTTSNSFSGFNKPSGAGIAQSPFGGPSLDQQAKKDATSSTFGGFNFSSTADAEGKPGQAAPSSLFNNLKPQSSAPTSLFSKPPTPAGPPKPFIEDGSDDSPTSSPTKPESTSLAAVADKPAAPSFSFTAPATSKSEGKKPASDPFALFQKPAEVAKQPSQAPSFLPETSTSSLATPNNVGFAPPPPPKPAGPPPSFSFQPSKDSTTSARRGSGSDNFNKPAHPSPLAQSFTAGIDASETVKPAATAAPAFGTQQSSLAPSLHSSQSALPPSKPKAPKPVIPEPDFTTLINNIARDITLTPNIGLLDQYLDYTIGKIVTDIQESVYFERINAEADEYRKRALSLRYGKLWRETCRRRRLVKQGQDRRRRAKQRLLESKSQASDNGSVAGSGSVLGRSVIKSTMGAKQSRQQEVDSMFQQSIGNGRWSRMARQEEQSKAGSKRPTSSQSIESFAGSRATGHKRLKSTSRLDEDDNAAKTTYTSHPGALKRSSFRDALPDNPPIASTTKSNYFRLKAIGQTHLYDLAPTHPRKRRHAEVSESPGPESARRSTTQASPPQQMLPPSSKLRRSSSVKSRHTADETDAVIARARAAREALRDGAGFLQNEAAKAEQADPLRQSTGSQVLYESPSLDRARLDARLRASQRENDFGSSRRSDVPAYRLRESKFVPRENYGKAIDRPREFRQSRSGNSSRPESRTDAHTPTKPAETITSQPIPAALTDAAPVAASNQAITPTFGGQFQSREPIAGPSQASTRVTSFGASASSLSASRSVPTFGATSSGATQQQQVQQPGHPTMQPPPHFGLAQTQPSLTSSNIQDLGSTSVQPLPSFGFPQAQPSQATQDTQDFFGQPDVVHPSTNYRTGFARDAEEIATTSVNANINNIEDNDDELEVIDFTTSHVNGNNVGHTNNGSLTEHFSVNEEETEEHEDDDQTQTLGHVNPYAALANGFSGDEDAESDEEQYGYASGQQGHYPGDLGAGEFEDEDGDGDVDEDEEDFDEDEDELSDDEDEDEDGERPNGGQYLAQQQADYKPPGNSFAPQAAADNEVIELSD